jgi:DHA1 family multidrug resistance protein-like MFS transporter
MVGVLGYAAAMFVFGLTTRIWMLYLARTFSGVLSSAALPTAMAYIGDNLPEKERSSAMGQLGAAVGLGVVLGPMLGGLLSTDSLSLPFFIGSGLALVALLLVYLLLPESHGASAQTYSATKPGNFWQWGTLKQILSGPTGVLMLLILILSFGMTNFQGIVGLYVVDKFAFDTRQVGAIWMVIGAVMILGQGILTGPLTKRLGEVTVIRLGLFIGAAGFGSLLLANGFGFFLLATGIFTLAVALIGPALNSILSAFGGDHQGALMGLNTAFASMGRVIGPLWAGFIFDVNIAFPFISGMVTLFLGSIFSLASLKTGDNQPVRSPG